MSFVVEITVASSPVPTGSYDIDFTVTDTCGNTNSGTLTINVTNVVWESIFGRTKSVDSCGCGNV